MVGIIFGNQGVPVADLAKPAVRFTLTTAGKHAAIRLGHARFRRDRPALAMANAGRERKLIIDDRLNCAERRTGCVKICSVASSRMAAIQMENKKCHTTTT